MTLALFQRGTNNTPFFSYATVAEADTYMLTDRSRGRAWDALSNEEKELRLIDATRKIDAHPFSGTPAGEANIGGSEVPVTTHFPLAGESEVPAPIVEATIMVAGSPAIKPTPQTQSRDFKRVELGSLEIEYTTRQNTPSVVLEDPYIKALLNPYLTQSSPISSVGSGNERLAGVAPRGGTF